MVNEQSISLFIKCNQKSMILARGPQTKFVSRLWAKACLATQGVASSNLEFSCDSIEAKFEPHPSRASFV